MRDVTVDGPESMRGQMVSRGSSITRKVSASSLIAHRNAVNGKVPMGRDEESENPYTTNVGFHSYMMQNDEPCSVRALVT